MSRLAYALLTLSLLVLPAAAGADDAKIFPYDTHVENLDNGLKIVIVPMSSGGLATYWTVVRTGARDEWEKNRTGFAHFFEHMMFRGTDRYPADAYNAKTTEIGADTNAFTSDDLTAYHLSITSNDVETVMDLESDRFQNLAYPEELFKTEAGAVYGEYRKNRTNPFFTIFEAVQAEAFKVHTYGHTAMGYEEDIKLMPGLFDYSKGFFSRYYRPENIVLMIVGDVDVAKTMERVKHYYGAWEPGYVTPQIQAEPEQTAERRIEVAYPGRSLPIVALAYKFPAFDASNPIILAADILTDLYFGETSALNKKLVLNEQVAEFLDASAPMNRDPNLLTIFARIKDPEKVDYVIAEIDRTIVQAQTKLLDADRIAGVTSRLKYGFLMGLDTPSRVAQSLVRFIAITGGVADIETMYTTYGSVTAEHVQAAAKQFLAPERRTVAVLREAN